MVLGEMALGAPGFQVGEIIGAAARGRDQVMNLVAVPPTPPTVPVQDLLATVLPPPSRSQVLGDGALLGLQRSLNRAASMLTAGAVDDALLVDWAQLRYQHVAALRAALLEAGAAPATINLILSAVRGTFREAWRLGPDRGPASARGATGDHTGAAASASAVSARRKLRTGPASVVLTSAQGGRNGSITTRRAPRSRTARHSAYAPPSPATHKGTGSGVRSTASGTALAFAQCSRAAIRAGASSKLTTTGPAATCKAACRAIGQVAGAHGAGRQLQHERALAESAGACQDGSTPRGGRRRRTLIGRSPAVRVGLARLRVTP